MGGNSPSKQVQISKPVCLYFMYTVVYRWCLLFDFSPSHASCSVNAVLNHPGGKLLSLLTVVTQC